MMTWYLQLNLAILIFGTLGMCLSQFALSSRQRLKLHYLFIFLALVTGAAVQFQFEAPYEFPVRGLSGEPVNFVSHQFDAVSGSFSRSQLANVLSYKPHQVPNLIYVIMIGMVFLIAWKTIISFRHIQGAFQYKQVGKLKVLISQNYQTPYAFSLFHRSYVVLPEFLLTEREQFHISLKHELQHIRNRDTGWLFLLEGMTSICFLNPLVYLWKNQILLEQEFACDESLIAQNKIPPRDYANCLLQVVEATKSQRIPFGATGMIWGKMKSQLSRRIEKMKYPIKESKPLFRALFAAGVAIFCVSALALRAPAEKISMEDLQEAVNANDFQEFPIEMNESVLKELNRFSSNSKWKKFVRESLKRYEQYKPLIDSVARKLDMPTELAAVAFIESGFKNRPDRETSISTVGAGIWQFIPKTARRFGLIVNNEVDERLNIPLATEAALQYLKFNTVLLGDLRLALLGYYVGEMRILNDIKNYGTRDPWILMEQAGYKTPYLPRVMAAAILLKYPSLVL